MADGRAFTDYSSPGISHALLARKFGFEGGDDGFRHSLQANPGAARKMVVIATPPTPVTRARPGKDVPGAADHSPVNCAPGYFPSVL